MLSLASRERVRGRPQGGRRGQGLALELLSLSEATVGGDPGPSKRDSHAGLPRPDTRRARISVTASMSSAGSITAGREGGEGVSALEGLPQRRQEAPPMCLPSLLVFRAPQLQPPTPCHA